MKILSNQYILSIQTLKENLFDKCLSLDLGEFGIERLDDDGQLRSHLEHQFDFALRASQQNWGCGRQHRCGVRSKSHGDWHQGACLGLRQHMFNKVSVPQVNAIEIANRN